MFCEIPCFSFVSMLKTKTISKKLDPDVSIPSGNSKSYIPATKKTWAGLKEISLVHIDIKYPKYVTFLGFNHSSLRFRAIF